MPELSRRKNVRARKRRVEGLHQLSPWVPRHAMGMPNAQRAAQDSTPKSPGRRVRCAQREKSIVRTDRLPANLVKWTAMHPSTVHGASVCLGFTVCLTWKRAALAVTPCPTGAICPRPQVEHMELEPGFWRVSNLQTTLLRCKEFHACQGGQWNQTCRQGHHGPLCHVCKPGYAKSDGLCAICPTRAVGPEHFCLHPRSSGAVAYSRAVDSVGQPRRWPGRSLQRRVQDCHLVLASVLALLPVRREMASFGASVV